MKKFYINQVSLPESDWEHRCIGLFDNNKWKGEGTFCGYYGVEFYLDTTLIAFGIQLIKGNQPYNPKFPFDGGFIENANRHFDKIPIGSNMWEKTIEAENAEEAIKIFKSQSWSS